MKKKLKKKALWKKVICCFMITILLFSSMFFYCNCSAKEEKYIQPDCLMVSIEKNSNLDFLKSNIDSYIKEIQNQGYDIASYNLDIKGFSSSMLNQSIIKDEKGEENQKKYIKDNLTVDINAVKIVIKDTNYYFQDNLKSENFINELNSYIKQDYEKEDVIIKISEVTSQDIINKKIEEVKIEKQKIDEIEREKELERKRQEEIKKKEQEAKRKLEQEKNRQNSVQVSSRGGNVVRQQNSSYSRGAPMASYIYVSSPYGMRNGSMHTGVDLAAPQGTHIYAWKSGKVIQAGWCGSYGNFIAIDHGDGTVSRYAHLSGYNCSVGQYVNKGDTIGFVGSTGNSTGPHLHWEVQINGSFVNPGQYL